MDDLELDYKADGLDAMIFVVGFLLLPITLVLLLMYSTYMGVQVGLEMVRKEMEDYPLEEREKLGVH